MYQLKLIFVSTLAHVVASIAFVFSTSLYIQLSRGKEAWPVIGIALILAFILETVLLLIWFRHQKSTIHLSTVSLSVIASWFIGLINFLTLGSWVGFLPITAPIFSWLLSSLSLFILLLLSVRPQT